MRSPAARALAVVLLGEMVVVTASAASPEGDTARSLFDAKYITDRGV
jgi:hypothetical protein